MTGICPTVVLKLTNLWGFWCFDEKGIYLQIQESPTLSLLGGHTYIRTKEGTKETIEIRAIDVPELMLLWHARSFDDMRTYLLIHASCRLFLWMQYSNIYLFQICKR